jgi:hypothetical protein
MPQYEEHNTYFNNIIALSISSDFFVLFNIPFSRDRNSLAGTNPE